MKKFLSLGIALVMLINIVEFFPTTNAPQGESRSQYSASILQDNSQSEEQQVVEGEKSLLLNLLELYVDQQRDFPKAATVIDQTERTDANKQLLQLFEAKILARTLDFGTAEQLLQHLQHEDAVLLKAAVLIAQGDKSTAKEYLHQIVEESSSPYARSSALSLLNIYNEYDLHRDTNQSYLWTLFAQQMIALGEYEISLYLSQKALDNNTEYRDAWMLKGYSEYLLEKFQEAEASLLSAYQQDPGNSQIQYLLGLTYFELDKPDLSTQYLIYAQENETKYQNIILEKLAENALKNKDYPLAEHYFTTLIKQQPKNINAYTQLIGLYGGNQLQNLPEALVFAQELVNIAPEDPNSHQLLSWIYGKMGDLEKAAKYINMAEELQ